MSVTDVSDWEPADEEPLGTKPKQWVRDAEGVLWLWKESTTLRDRRHGPFRKGDDWAEVVAGRVGAHLGVPTAWVELATRGEQFGVISRTVLVGDREVLVHGNELLAEAGLASAGPRDRLGYTVAAVESVLEQVAPPVPSNRLPTAFDWFAGYLLLDALVGNTDRHQDNWATIRSPHGRRLAPSFDHASCLGFLLSDEERSDRLSGVGARTVVGYAAAATTKFEDNPTTLEVAIAALERTTDAVQGHWRDRLERTPSLDDALSEVPEDRMSQAARRFARALYARNHELLSHHLRTMGP